jgi:hypothetical protein
LKNNENNIVTAHSNYKNALSIGKVKNKDQYVKQHLSSIQYEGQDFYLAPESPIHHREDLSP